MKTANGINAVAIIKHDFRAIPAATIAAVIDIDQPFTAKALLAILEIIACINPRWAILLSLGITRSLSFCYEFITCVTIIQNS